MALVTLVDFGQVCLRDFAGGARAFIALLGGHWVAQDDSCVYFGHLTESIEKLARRDVYRSHLHAFYLHNWFGSVSTAVFQQDLATACIGFVEVARAVALSVGALDLIVLVLHLRVPAIAFSSVLRGLRVHHFHLTPLVLAGVKSAATDERLPHGITVLYN